MQRHIATRSPELVSAYIQIPDDIETIDFDTYLIDECFVLKNIAGYLFKKTMNDINFHICEVPLTRFISLLCDNYNKNHFHNFQHAVNVLQMTYYLLRQTIMHKLNPHIVLGTLISALSHDVDHPGNTNTYEINSISKLALLYNDISVLENHHCTLTFELMEQSGLTKSFAPDVFREIRKTVITCILNTDMSKHHETINKFDKIDFDKDDFTVDEQIIIVSCFVHYADLSNQLKHFEISYEWSKRISSEFYEQTIKEENEGLTSLAFMKIHDSQSICLNEINFIVNVSLPMWTLFVTKFKNTEYIIDRVNNTLNKWRELEKQYLANNIHIINY